MAAPASGPLPAAAPLPVVVARVEALRGRIDAVAVRYHVSQALIEAVVSAESGGNPDAFRVEAGVNDASFGLMQVLWGTARSIGFTGPVRDLFLPDVSLDLGTHYLHDLLATYPDTHTALVAYNGGPLSALLYTRGHRGFRADRYATEVRGYESFYRVRNLSSPGGAR